MFDISWGELLLLGTVGVAITGKRDMPKVCRLVGNQVGRVVGLLQGARLRADKFTQHNELRSLQNELRSGLRELDQVKMELAVAASSHGIMGRALGPTTSSANNNNNSSSNNNNNNIYRANKNTAGTFPPSMLSSSAVQQRPNVASTAADRATTNDGGGTGMDAFDFHVVSSSSSSSDTTKDAHGGGPQNQQHQQDVDRTTMKIGIAPEIQTERAVMEEEWDKQGIGFKSRAEQGRWNTTSTTAATTTAIGRETSSSSSSSVPDTTRATGSELLEHLERQVLIFDQYDRVVDQQEQEVQQRIHKQQKHKQEQQARSQKT